MPPPSAPTRPGPPASPNARQLPPAIPLRASASSIIPSNCFKSRSLTLPCSSPSCFSPPNLLFPLLRGGWGAGRGRVFQGAGISASATTAKPEVSRNRSCRREPRLDRRVLNMEFKGGKKPTPNPSPCTCSPRRGPHRKGWLRGRAGIARGCCRQRRRARSGRGDGVWGEHGERDPHSRHGGGRGVGAGWERSGWHRKAGHPCPHRGTALAGDVTAQPLPERGDPQSDPGAPRPPFPARLRALRRRRAGRAARSGKNGHMPKPFPETNNHPRGDGHAWPPTPGEGPCHRPPTLRERP